MKKTDLIDSEKLTAKLIEIAMRDKDGLKLVIALAGASLDFMQRPCTGDNPKEVSRLFVTQALKNLGIDPESICKNINLN